MSTSRIRYVSGLAPAIDVATVADADHFHDHALIVDRVDDAVNALSNAVKLAASREFLAARGARVFAQRFDRVKILRTSTLGMPRRSFATETLMRRS